jgi:hypothetical protein
MAKRVAFYVRVSTGPASRKAVNVPASFAAIRRLRHSASLSAVSRTGAAVAPRNHGAEILKEALDLGARKKPSCCCPGRGRNIR